MKKFLLSVFAAAMAIGANAANDMYLKMEDQTKTGTNNFKRIAVTIEIENDVNVCNFDANIQLGSPMTYQNFTTFEDEGVIYPEYDGSDRLNLYASTPSTAKTKKQVEFVKIMTESNRLFFSVTSMDASATKGQLNGTSGAVYTFYFDASSLTTGDYKIYLKTNDTSSEAALNYESFVSTFTGTDALGKIKTQKIVEKVDKTFTFHIDQENGTVKAVVPAKEYKDGSSTAVDVNFDYTTYTPTGNSILVVDDAKGADIHGNNVVYLEGGVYKCKNLVITDGASFYSPVDFTAANASYDRTSDKEIISICLPYAVAKANITTGEAAYLSDYDKANAKVTFTKTDDIEANKPYLIQNRKADGKVVNDVTNAEVKATPASMETVAGSTDKATHFGQYSQSVYSDGVTYDYYAYGNNKFYRVKNLTVPAFRTAVKLDHGPLLKSGSSKLDELSIEFVDGKTSIETISNENGKVNVYDIVGRAIRLNVEASEALEGLKDGVYVVNGKKVIIRNK